jgi:hypothetical protein
VSCTLGSSHDPAAAFDRYFAEACGDVSDIQQGTTGEVVHLSRKLWIEAERSFRFLLRRVAATIAPGHAHSVSGHSLDVHLTHDTLTVRSRDAGPPGNPSLGLKDVVYELAAASTLKLKLQ